VLKDGLGQFGGMFYAALVSRRFDADPKRWRMRAAYVLNASCVLETITPLVPALFLPVAALANLGKNVAWITMSAARASLHTNLLRGAQKSNIADVTARAGSQAMAASVWGTALGIALSSTDTVGMLLPAVLVLGSANCVFAHLSLRHVVLRNLDARRFRVLVDAYHERGVVLTPRQVNDAAAATFFSSSSSRGVPTRVGAPLHTFAAPVAFHRRFALSADGAQLAFHRDARAADVFLGHVAAFKLQRGITRDADDDDAALLDAVTRRGWSLEHVHLDGHVFATMTTPKQRDDNDDNDNNNDNDDNVDVPPGRYYCQTL
jgi:hypothetical protein